ncbi:MAG: YvcK family protein [Coriobacteriia bacterium]|nr:YvcK family protein [Coriobacteriia bacterium]
MDDVCTQASDPLKAVVIGGGSGSPLSIKALLAMGLEVDSVVAMADDGGSTGLLRDVANVTAPGDIRKNLVAMAQDPTDPFCKAFRTRFQFADNHTLGNLMLVALEECTGSFPEAIRICAELLHARGNVYPSTLCHVNMGASTRDGRTLEGQAAACHANAALERVWLDSKQTLEAYEPALAAIRQANLVVLGPGSLYTSIIPNLLVPGVVDAIRQSQASTVFVSSVADVQGETWGLTAREHLQALLDHGMEGLVHYMLVHVPTQDMPNTGTRTVTFQQEDIDAIHNAGTVVLARDLADHQAPTRHNAQALQAALGEVLSLCRSRRK